MIFIFKRTKSNPPQQFHSASHCFLSKSFVFVSCGPRYQQVARFCTMTQPLLYLLDVEIFSEICNTSISIHYSIVIKKNQLPCMVCFVNWLNFFSLLLIIFHLRDGVHALYKVTSLSPSQTHFISNMFFWSTLVVEWGRHSKFYWEGSISLVHCSDHRGTQVYIYIYCLWTQCMRWM